ncbi:MAG: FGGY family carbohydrate kinase [Atribacterota bacterium]
MGHFFLTIDVGTTSVKLIVWDEGGQKVYRDSFSVHLNYPREGWVELDPHALFQKMKERMDALEYDFSGVGIANQRETTILWDGEGKAVYPAIVWQDRRTADWCQIHQEKEKWLFEKTGLYLDPYFSLSKIVWILNEIGSYPGPLHFGTLDSYLVWKLTGGQSYITDYTNASRTLVFNLQKLAWDEEIIREFGLQKIFFPLPGPSFQEFGKIFLKNKKVPLYVILGDQQASFLGQGCFQERDTKNTYGTGCFVMMNCGAKRPDVPRGFLVTLATLDQGEPVFVLEGSALSAGVVMEWLVNLGIISYPGEAEQIARQAVSTHHLLMVPSFTGLGAPYWDPFARGALLGISPQIGKNEIVRASLQAVAFESADLLKVMENSFSPIHYISVDGGMSQNSFLMQFQADISEKAIHVFPDSEATSLGVYYLLGKRLGFLDRDFIENMKRAARIYEPAMDSKERNRLWNLWKKGIERVKGWAKNEEKV